MTHLEDALQVAAARTCGVYHMGIKNIKANDHATEPDEPN
jgi:hypothetical protein